MALNIIATDNKRVVVGLGMTGMSCARYFARNKQTFSVVDSRENPPGLAEFKIQFPDVSIKLGAFNEHDLFGFNQLVVSPGVALDEPAIQSAVNRGAEVCGDIDLFCKEAKAPIIAVTGSNGKSTVTTLIGKMLARAGRCVAVGGNIGIPVLDLLLEKTPDFYALELSSFQLERAAHLGLDIVTVLNVSADHMDRYPNLMSYHRAKHRIFRGCKKVIVNRADPLSRPLIADDIAVWTFGLNAPDFKGFGLTTDQGVEFLTYEFERLMPVFELKMVGRHNIENVLAALALGTAAGIALTPMLDVLREFTGLSHRCQFVLMSNKISYFNDSKGTNVGAAAAAIKGLSADFKKVVLIAGGDAKGADLSPLVPVMQEHCRAAVVIGEAAKQLQLLLQEKMSVVVAATMAEAVAQATHLAESGDAVLLSPACASFDMFDNYEHRGNVFADSVVALAAREGS